MSARSSRKSGGLSLRVKAAVGIVAGIVALQATTIGARYFQASVQDTCTSCVFSQRDTLVACLRDVNAQVKDCYARAKQVKNVTDRKKALGQCGLQSKNATKGCAKDYRANLDSCDALCSDARD